MNPAPTQASGPAAPRRLPQVPRAAPPPFVLPGEHFAAALVWLGVAAVMLPSVAPRLARGSLFEPAVFALLHVLVLGVVTSAIFGALSQFVPGGLEVPLKSVRLGHWGFGFLQAGVLALVIGFLRWQGALQAVGWILFFGAVGAASINFLPARRRSPHGKLVGLYLTTAHSALGAGMFIAAARIGVTLGWWQLDRLGLLAAHLHFGAVGFGTLTAFGVGSRMLPTFLLSRRDDTRRLEWLLGLAIPGLVLIGVGALGGGRLATLAGAAFLLASSAVMLTLLWGWFGGRNRPLDAALWHVAAAGVGLVASVGWGVAALVAGPGGLRVWAGYVVSLVVGWLVLLVTGVVAKILSHLSYIHLFRVMPGFAAIGNPNRLLRSDLGLVSCALLAAGGLGLPAAIAGGWPTAAIVLAWLWSLGVAGTLANYAQAIARGLRSA